MIRQLDILWVDLEPAKGHETKKKRPCVVVQSDMVNLKAKTFLVAPMLPRHRDFPFAVNLAPSKRNGLDMERHINLMQIRVSDLSRIGSQQGRLEDHYLPQIREALDIVFGIKSDMNIF